MGIGISYDVQPSEIPAKVQISANGKTLHAQIQDIGDFGFSITPSGGIGEEIISGIVWPIANLVAGLLKDQVVNAITGIGFDVMQVPDVPIQVGNVTVTLQPANMNLANYDSMLLIGCDVNIV